MLERSPGWFTVIWGRLFYIDWRRSESCNIVCACCSSRVSMQVMVRLVVLDNSYVLCWYWFNSLTSLQSSPGPPARAEISWQWAGATPGYSTHGRHVLQGWISTVPLSLTGEPQAATKLSQQTLLRFSHHNLNSALITTTKPLYFTLQFARLDNPIYVQVWT